MFCQLGQGIRAKVNRSELEVSVATKNYRFTGLARYKQTLVQSEFELTIARGRLEQHQRNCGICSGAADDITTDQGVNEFA